ncbi:MAG: ABC transporter ATP-binding protein [Planctomycetes bacterium]|nr:ABC transporter ATP-binding protein [Planctomycetota bacterium]
MSGTPAILCRGVGKVYGDGDSAVTALRGIDLTASFGEIVALVGPSGCGKTTLISIFAAILSRGSGTLELVGVDPDAMSNQERTLFRREKIGFIFQQFNLVPQVSVIENVAIPLLLRGESRSESLDRAAILLKEVGLENRAGSRPAKLSGGQQQRVAIARSLIHGPSILVCDEPTSALDGATGQRVMELIREQGRRPDRLVILVTHDERIYHFADRIAHMDDGLITRIVNSDVELAALRAAAIQEEKHT